MDTQKNDDEAMAAPADPPLEPSATTLQTEGDDAPTNKSSSKRFPPLFQDPKTAAVQAATDPRAGLLPKDRISKKARGKGELLNIL